MKKAVPSQAGPSGEACWGGRGWQGVLKSESELLLRQEQTRSDTRVPVCVCMCGSTYVEDAKVMRDIPEMESHEVV